MKATHLAHRRSSAADLHNLEVGDLVPPARRSIILFEVTGPAIVLGSAQPDTHVDGPRAAAAEVAVVRRRSGGGAVWVAPDDPIWIDVWIPRDDPHWHADVGRAFAPVGAAFARALRSVGSGSTPPELQVHAGPMVRTDASAQVCFAGVGPGEVLWRDRKIVGISQRRTRDGARFQCAIYRRWDPAALHRLLAEPPALRTLASVGAGLETLSLDSVGAEDVMAALHAEL